MFKGRRGSSYLGYCSVKDNKSYNSWDVNDGRFSEIISLIYQK